MSYRKFAASAAVGADRLRQQILKVTDSAETPALNSAESK